MHQPFPAALENDFLLRSEMAWHNRVSGPHSSRRTILRGPYGLYPENCPPPRFRLHSAICNRQMFETAALSLIDTKTHTVRTYKSIILMTTNIHICGVAKQWRTDFMYVQQVICASHVGSVVNQVALSN